MRACPEPDHSRPPALPDLQPGTARHDGSSLKYILIRSGLVKLISVFLVLRFTWIFLFCSGLLFGGTRSLGRWVQPATRDYSALHEEDFSSEATVSRAWMDGFTN